MDMTSLSYLQTPPQSTAVLRSEPSDFQVREILPFSFDGEGEHHYLYVRKIGQNTAYVAKVIARFAGVPPRDVSVAGQKDRHAVTEQWFCVRIPGKDEPNWSEINTDQIQVLEHTRHRKKLRTGALAGNRFELLLRDVVANDDLEARLKQIELHGVPNYFGEQRFGQNGNNLTRAYEMFAGRKAKDRHKRGMYLSAARAYLFNLSVSARIAQHGVAGIDGDALMLSGSRSYFQSEAWDQTLQKRLDSQDIQLSAPLWGKGPLASQGQALALERAIGDASPELVEGLAQYGLEQERRPLLLHPQNFQYEWDAQAATLKLSFVLPAGAFATAVVREITTYVDAQSIEKPNENG
ncbi:tRNA pseudouridine(13) synthase TruD [Paraferrimonas sedimenticola]|uniref:tRNA pseudouridine synthase D n=1 Tax=Paraferrimonas sedimenticola TaxID=375674 RepID=A0AA37W107_9GAMM|nr:tRNA pseudouridine(13) synthase TruD [Paraferrimonas sedimenticola]GLP96865.1 tRNA pseudouridine synthase D [Paraferrimonas sedimenticola]